MKQRNEGRHKCRNTGCSNYYDDVIGEFGKGKAGAVCIPCLYAEQMVDQGQTVEQVEVVPHLMAMFTELLGNTGWTWEHVRAAHARMGRSKDGNSSSSSTENNVG